MMSLTCLKHLKFDMGNYVYQSKPMNLRDVLSVYGHLKWQKRSKINFPVWYKKTTSNVSYNHPHFELIFKIAPLFLCTMS